MKVMSFAPSVFSRAILFLGSPFIELNVPPKRIFPSPWSEMLQTMLSAPVPGSKEASIVPSGRRRTILLEGEPLNDVKSPPHRIRPSGCRLRAKTVKSNPASGVNVASKLPSLFNRAIRLRFTPFTWPNPPPMMIFPSGWSTIDVTVPFKPVPVLNVGSIEPSTLRRVSQRTTEPLYVLKFPPTIALPSSWRAMAQICKLNPVPVR